jgi:hypothetical protein
MKTASSVGVALIGDLVGSRRHPSRAAAQEQLIAALHVANEVVPAVQPLAPTVGDEFQGVYRDVAAAARAGLVVRLALGGEIDTRCGIGVGTLEIVGSSDYGLTQDGPAWWAARDAIVEAKRREGGQTKRLRTWLEVHDPGDRDDTFEIDVHLVNAFLLCRDDLVSRLDARQRRLVLGLLRGRTQKDLAAEEGISASAVSQSLHRSGAFSVLAADALMAASSS